MRPQPRAHARPYRLRAEESGLEIHGNRMIEVRLGDVLERMPDRDPGVVDENVDRAERLLDA